MTVLAVDTSHAKGTLALAHLQDGKIEFIHEATWLKKAMHSEVATLELQRLISESHLSLKNITHLAVNIGPGSFTGIRVGLNLVRTLAYALSIPVACFNGLEVAASRNSEPGEQVVAASRAIQNFYYAAAYSHQQTLVELAPPQSIESPEAFAAQFGCTKVLLDKPNEARDLVHMLVGNGARQFFSWRHVTPLYIRASEAEEKLKKGILKP